MNIAKKRMYKTPENGGLGLFNLRDFINKVEYPICHGISTSYKRFSNMFASTDENFYSSYIFENKKSTLNLDTVETLNRTQFSDVSFAVNASKLYNIKI
jgi:hypothetical protein